MTAARSLLGRLLSRLLCTALLVSAIGCTGLALRPDMRAAAGQSPAWQDGYADGCHSGYVAGGSLFNAFKRDTTRAKNDANYRQGWKLAYKQCKDAFRQMCIDGGAFSRASWYCSDVREQGLDRVE